MSAYDQQTTYSYHASQVGILSGVSRATDTTSPLCLTSDSGNVLDGCLRFLFGMLPLHVSLAGLQSSYQRIVR